MPRPKRTERLNLTIDQTLKLQFDAICTLKGLSMSDVVQGLVESWLKENASPEFLIAIQNESNRELPSSTKGKGAKQQKGGK